MKSNLFKKATALGVAAAMVLSTSAFAMSDVASLVTNQKSDGSGSVLSPTYKIKVPTSLTFAVDPYELGGLATGSAINPRSAIKVPGYGYAISNQSNIAVSVAVEATLTSVATANVFTVPLADINTNFTTLAGLTSMGATTPVEVKDATNLNKEISMYMLIASTGGIVTTTGATQGTAAAGTVFTSDGALELNYASTDPEEKPARATFLLDKGFVVPATGLPSGVINTSPTAFGVFSFQGDVNAIAPWVKDDVKVSVKYLFAPVSAANKETISTGTPGYQAEMQAVIAGTAAKCDNTPVQPKAPFFGASTSDPAAPISKANLTTTDSTIAIGNLGEGYRTLSNTGSSASTIKFTGATTLSLAATEFTFDETAKSLIIKGASNSKIKALAEGTYTLEFTAKNGRTVKASVVIGA